MKKLSVLMIAIIMVFAGNTYAQIDQGTWMVGGNSNFGFLSTDTSPDKTTNISLEVSPGYFIMENFAAGLGIGYNRQNQGDFSGTATVIGPWARYYVDGAFFFGASYSSVSSKSEYSSGENKSTGSALGLEVGYAYFLNKKVALEPAINYSSFGGDFDGTTIGLTVGLSVYF